MKLCLCFHCLCESYDDLSGDSRELFVSLDDMKSLIEKLLERGYKFTNLEDTGDKTVSITFDDGYANNQLFRKLAEDYQIPFVVFVSAYYTHSGEGFPWIARTGSTYNNMYRFDYYSHHAARAAAVTRTTGCPTAGICPHARYVFPTVQSENKNMAFYVKEWSI